jgi:hypothetical protein
MIESKLQIILSAFLELYEVGGGRHGKLQSFCILSMLLSNFLVYSMSSHNCDLILDEFLHYRCYQKAQRKEQEKKKKKKRGGARRGGGGGHKVKKGRGSAHQEKVHKNDTKSLAST